MNYKKPPDDRSHEIDLNKDNYGSYRQTGDPKQFTDSETQTICYVTVPKDFSRLNISFKWIARSKDEKPVRKIFISFYFDGSDKMSSTEAEDPQRNFEEEFGANHYYFYEFYATYPEFSDTYVGLQIFKLEEDIVETSPSS